MSKNHRRGIHQPAAVCSPCQDDPPIPLLCPSRLLPSRLLSYPPLTHVHTHSPAARKGKRPSRTFKYCLSLEMTLKCPQPFTFTVSTTTGHSAGSCPAVTMAFVSATLLAIIGAAWCAFFVSFWFPLHLNHDFHDLT